MRLWNNLAKADWGGIARALAIGAVGGAIFDLLTLPLAWMLGAMVSVTIGAVMRARVAVPTPLRALTNGILGLVLGSAFTPEIFDRAGEWAFTLSVLIAYVVISAATIAVFFRRVLGYDPVTAYFSAMPGGIAEMTVVGAAMGGDGRTIALFHGARVLIVAISIPMGFRFLAGYVPQGVQALGGPIEAIGIVDVTVLVVCGVVGYLVAERIGVPAPTMTGPLVLSAIAHAFGLTDAKLPVLLIAFGQLGVGAAIGCRFSSANPRVVLRTLYLAAGTVVIMLALTICFAFGLAAITTWPREALLLAYAPGGIAEMCLVALVLGFDVSFVATHHVVRFVFVVLAAPIFAKYAVRKRLSS